jgi:hypothetical protein
VMMQGGPAYTHIPAVIDALESLAGKLEASNPSQPTVS